MKIIKTKTLKSSDALKKAVDVLLKGTKNVFVTENGKLVGVVGIRDVLLLVKKGKVEPGVKIKTIMKKVERVTNTQPVEYAYVLMKKYNTASCPVVDKKEKFLGIVSLHDVCQEMIENIKKE